MGVSLDQIVNVSVRVSNPSSITSNFNLGLIIGNSTVFDGVSTRLKEYSRSTYAEEMVTDGFSAENVEYLAAQAYFSQNPAPSSVLIGVKLEAETEAQAVTACRNADSRFYGFCFSYDTTDSNMTAVATAIATFDSPAILFYSTKDDKCLQTGQTNIMKTMQDAKYNNVCGFYSTQTYFIAGVLGVFSGLNTMQANSAYTMAFKSVIGFNPENINTTQYSAIKSYNGNVYAEYAGRYTLISPGLMASGYHIDFQFLIDCSKYLIQQYTVSGLVARRIVPQTQSGVTDIVSFITNACEILRSMGVIATGIWNGESVLNLNTGDAIQNGYYIQADSIYSQSQNEREERVTPPIYVALKAAGAIEHVVIQVFVNQ